LFFLKPLFQQLESCLHHHFDLKTTKQIIVTLAPYVTTCCVFLDIKSAFDAAWHPAILNFLINKNDPAFPVKLLANFLSSRSCMLSSPLASKVTNIELGCPQGNVLSPFLWNILLEDLLCLIFPFPFRFIAYADDIVVCTMHKDYNLRMHIFRQYATQ
jgi:hypothetical protein